MFIDEFGTKVDVTSTSSKLTTQSQWVRTLTSNVAINSGTTFNIFQTVNGLTEANKSATGTATHDPYTITDSATAGRIIVPWAGVNMDHIIRVNGSFVNGGTEILRCELYRATDGVVLGTKQVGRNNDNSTWSIEFATFTRSATDAFVTQGFGLRIVSASGNANVALASGSTLGVLVLTSYETPRNI